MFQLNTYEVMKKTFFLLSLVGFLATQASATPEKSRKAKAPKLSMEQQLSKYITYPEAMKSTQQAGVVVIQFRVNDANELNNLKVFTKNEELNSTIVKQLVGKKLVGYGDDSEELHTVRLRFQPE
ncbi:hypothetical protein GCM10028817_42560 [Spirosoma pomorum]